TIIDNFGPPRQLWSNFDGEVYASYGTPNEGIIFRLSVDNNEIVHTMVSDQSDLDFARFNTYNLEGRTILYGSNSNIASTFYEFVYSDHSIKKLQLQFDGGEPISSTLETGYFHDYNNLYEVDWKNLTLKTTDLSELQEPWFREYYGSPIFSAFRLSSSQDVEGMVGYGGTLNIIGESDDYVPFIYYNLN
ncbi:MAG: hypothetical protein RIF46_11550, partial [Cyclobacteriaceae bacterium]